MADKPGLDKTLQPNSNDYQRADQVRNRIPRLADVYAAIRQSEEKQRADTLQAERARQNSDMAHQTPGAPGAAAKITRPAWTWTSGPKRGNS